MLGTFTYKRGEQGSWVAYYRAPHAESAVRLCDITRDAEGHGLPGKGWFVLFPNRALGPFANRWEAAFNYLAEKNSPVSEAIERETESGWRESRVPYRDRPKHLTEVVANKVYNILVEFCGAHESGRKDFVYHQTTGEFSCAEYRFGGWLGSGGKFYCTDKWYVSCYTEDYDPETRLMIAEANAALLALHREA